MTSGATNLVCSLGCGGAARFQLDGAPRCLKHTLTYRRLLKRSLLTAAVVGTILLLINQGDVILGGDFPGELFWKIPLTYSVPFSVATWGALINTRIRG